MIRRNSKTTSEVSGSRRYREGFVVTEAALHKGLVRVDLPETRSFVTRLAGSAAGWAEP